MLKDGVPPVSRYQSDSSACVCCQPQNVPLLSFGPKSQLMSMEKKKTKPFRILTYGGHVTCIFMSLQRSCYMHIPFLSQIEMKYLDNLIFYSNAS